MVRYFASLGIQLDYTAIIIALGMIPVFWLVAFIVKALTIEMEMKIGPSTLPPHHSLS